MAARAMSGWRLWLTGWPDQASVYAAHAEAHAERLAHPFSLVYALLYGVLVRQGRGDFAAAAVAAQHLASVAREQGFVYYEVVGMLLQGSVWTQSGELERGLNLLTTGLAQYRRLGYQFTLPVYLTCLAEAHLRRGQVQEGLAVIGEAVQLTETNFARFWNAEVYRLRGELLLAQTDQVHPAPAPATATAEACFQQALAVAREQGAKALELRAAISLSRLWLTQDKATAAQQLLAGCYDWFSEGLETVDLQTARSMLARCQPVD